MKISILLTLFFVLFLGSCFDDEKEDDINIGAYHNIELKSNFDGVISITYRDEKNSTTTDDLNCYPYNSITVYINKFTAEKIVFKKEGISHEVLINWDDINIAIDASWFIAPI